MKYVILIIFTICFSAMAQEQNRAVSGSKAKLLYESMKSTEKTNYLIDEFIVTKENSEMKCYYINNYVYNVESYVCTKK